MPGFEAVVFPGQGSQKLGMGLDFADQFPEAKAVFDRSSGALGLDLLFLCASDEKRLNLTEFSQPCILATEIAIYAVLQSRFRLEPQHWGGHSLGEYTALVAAGVMSLEAAIRLVHERGRLMQESCPAGMGAMAAVIQEGLDRNSVEAIAASLGVDIANDNSPEQLVLGGEGAAVSLACTRLLRDYPAARIVPLVVSAPFHSRHMEPVRVAFTEILHKASLDFDASRLGRVMSNFSGQFHEPSIPALVNSLADQISGQVRWRRNMEALRQKTGAILEVGPGRVLSGFFKSIGVSVPTVSDLRTARRAFAQEGAA